MEYKTTEIRREGKYRILKYQEFIDKKVLGDCIFYAVQKRFLWHWDTLRYGGLNNSNKILDKLLQSKDNKENGKE